MEFKFRESHDKRRAGFSGWYCCKADDGMYYAVKYGNAPMNTSVGYYIITKAIYDQCGTCDDYKALRLR